MSTVNKVCSTCADKPNLCGGNPLSHHCALWVEKTDDAMQESFLDVKYEMDTPPKYYIHGSVDCASKHIIDRLKAKGGTNDYQLMGCDPGCIYYIGPYDHIIHRLEKDSDIFKNLILACGWIELK